MLKRLLDRLHRVFDKNPHTVTGLVISAPVPVNISIKDYIISVSGTGLPTSTISGTTTIAAFATILQSTYSATVTHNSNLAGRHACWLLEGQYSGTDIEIGYPDAPLYNEMQLYARLLTDQSGRLKQACDQVYMLLADDEWLDYWGRDYFGILRFTGETDDEYRQRVIHELLRPTQNNKALEAIVYEALGLRCWIRDAKPITGLADDAGRMLLDITLDNTLTPEAAQTLMDRVENVITRYKAAGTDFASAAIKANKPIDRVSVSEAYSARITAAAADDAYSPAVLKVGAGWKVGVPGLKIGINNALLEQVYVRKLNNSDLTVASSALYGG